jgi:hypothetical protein
VFRYRDFMLAWTSTSLVTMGVQIERVVLGWFILTKTDSPFLMAAIWSARLLRRLFGPCSVSCGTSENQ